ncbi:adenylyl-sulfate kinase [Tenuibacillus multivorans]|uniref:Adenylyl-sulfate kinase n=1 Tax=Tenuibacillus multivorans TaxID=237069 RepID=A0A1H0CZX7_9BACI|nr:adenylyl-sulfate kinase [Tenuibacillus multivorans]GEL76098.1 adenylyl-sulfate kinase [Tenuibacillus multivorans]SDN63477.1 adenylylsulfate kinase [Tenuibacillus multivorans]
MTNDIKWHHHQVSKEDRQHLNGQKSFVIWLTGLSGSGKSTIANQVEKELFIRGVHTYLLDGDNIRHGLNNNLGFSYQDRHENIRRIAECAKLFVDAGIVTIVAAISPSKADREQAKKLFKREEFVEVYIKCSLEECERRDPKGLYHKARSGEIKNFTGISQAYDEPDNPDLVIDTTNQSVSQSVRELRQLAEDRALKG